MALQTWWLYFLAACIIAVSPGPGAIISMRHGLAFGVRQTTPTIIGLQISLCLVLFAAGLGVASLLLASVTAFSLVKWAGAAYLIYLGVQQWRTKVVTADSTAGAEAQLAPLSTRQKLMTGFFVNAINPKGIVFMVAVLPQFIDPARALMPQLCIMAATMCAVDLVVMHSYAFAASRLRGWFQSAHALMWQNRVFGGVLIVAGVALLAFKK
jgi:homoserine/homoserine lactone efflux protein